MRTGQEVHDDTVHQNIMKLASLSTKNSKNCIVYIGTVGKKDK